MLLLSTSETTYESKVSKFEIVIFYEKMFHYQNYEKISIFQLLMNILDYNRTVVVQNKSSLLLKIIYKNTQTIQLFTMNIKTKTIYKSDKKCQVVKLGQRHLDS